MVKGCDNGYLFTKDNDKRIFKSAYSLSDESLTGGNKIIIDGETYYYGVGNTTSDCNKIYDNVTKVCTIANLCLTGQTEYHLVVGLPINQYKAKKDEFREQILSYNRCEIIYKNQRQRVHINDVAVYPQGAAAIHATETIEPCIVFDIGSYTVNIALFEMDGINVKITKSDTIFKGVLHLHEKVMKAINSKYDINLDVTYADQIIKNGLFLHGVKVDTSFIKEILYDYLKPIITQFKTTYPYQIYPIWMVGGGSILLYNIFQVNFLNIKLIPDAQFSNAIGYYKYGLKLWR